MSTPGFRVPGSAPPPWWRRRVVLGAIAVLVVALVIWRLASAPRGTGAAGSGPVAVVTATARQGPFTVDQSAVGNVTPLNEVTIRSQVTGRLVRVAFQGGEMVKQGELLAEIDPKPFQISVDSAAGELARDQAASANADATLKRYQQLLAENSVTPQQLADQQAAARQGAGDVQVAESRLADAKLQLGYTRITAPIDGMVGLPRVGAGNVVGPASPEGITSVTQLRPISVVFAIPGDALAGLVQRLQAGTGVPVSAYRSGGGAALATGRLLAVNNEIDPDTGTVKLKAEFDNASGTLFPNQFVTVKLPVQRLANAVQVPSTAIQHGADGTFVYAVGPKHEAVVTPVRAGPADGTNTVIESGLAAGAVVVVEGGDQLRGGVTVQPVAAPAAAHGSGASAPARGSSAGGQGPGRPQS